MNYENEWIVAPPFDLYQLELVRLVAERRSFTAAARVAGLTQSAVTRQIRGVEERLGVALFERTTRLVRVTDAGAMLVERGGAILASAGEACREVRERFGDASLSVRVGISRSMGIGYLPGFFDRFHRTRTDVVTSASQDDGASILRLLAEGDLDVGIVTARPKLSRELEISYQFDDRFVAVVPIGMQGFEFPDRKLPTAKQLARRMDGQRWVALARSSAAGVQVREWMDSVGLDEGAPAMELDSFDLIVNLVSQGMGVSIVPRRVLPLYVRRRGVKAIGFRPALRREVWVVVRKDRRRPKHISDFVESVLF